MNEWVGEWESECESDCESEWVSEWVHALDHLSKDEYLQFKWHFSNNWPYVKWVGVKAQ